MEIKIGAYLACADQLNLEKELRALIEAKIDLTPFFSLVFKLVSKPFLN